MFSNLNPLPKSHFSTQHGITVELYPYGKKSILNLEKYVLRFRNDNLNYKTSAAHTTNKAQNLDFHTINLISKVVFNPHRDKLVGLPQKNDSA